MRQDPAVKSSVLHQQFPQTPWGMCVVKERHGDSREEECWSSDTFLNKLQTKIFQMDGNEVQVALHPQWVLSIHSFQKYLWHIYHAPSTNWLSVSTASALMGLTF